jgi:membrane protein
VLGLGALVLFAADFRIYSQTIAVESITGTDEEGAVVAAGQAAGAALAALVWLWLSAMAVLSGGVLNAEVSRLATKLRNPKCRPVSQGPARIIEA